MENIDFSKIQEIKASLNDPQPTNIKLYLNDVTDQITQVFKRASTLTFPPHNSNQTVYTRTKNETNKNKPWFGPQCAKARTAYNKVRKAFQLNKSSLNKKKLNTASRHYKQTMNLFIRKHKYSAEKKLRDMSSSRPKDYWRYLNSLNKKQTNEGPDINSFYNHFKDINSETHSDPNLVGEDETYESRIYTIDALNRPITLSEIDKIISKCKNGKASSPYDNILNEHIKHTKDLMLPIYCDLFNMILDTGTLPDAWLVGCIKPIFKNKGQKEDPKNYRPITILSCLGKIFTSVLNFRINSFLTDNKLLNENQAGFRAHYSTTDHIFSLYMLIEKLRSEKKKLFCSFIDFTAAFDSVWRAGLWHKIFKLGIRGKVFNVIRNMYSDIKSCVYSNGNTSTMFTSSCGVRQGENLSPILFSMYLNDLEGYLKNNCSGFTFKIDSDETVYFLQLLVLLYADDAVIFSKDNTSLQQSLDHFNEYCKLWNLNVNYSKTKIMIFGARNTNAFSFTINNQNIEIVKEFKYLGVYFSSTGSFVRCRKHVVEQANKALFQLFHRINNLNLPVDLQLKLFDHTIVPILTYSCEVWGFENTDLIEKFHCNFLRRITKSRQTTPRYMLYAELSRLPIDIIIKSRMIKFWNTIIQSKHEKISHMLYQYMNQSQHNFKWMTYIKNIFDSTGYSNLWLNQSLITSKTTHLQIKQRLKDQFNQEWVAKLDNSSKGKNYSIFKDNTSFEQYLTRLPAELRISMFHFRTGNHRLPIETGRWNQSHVPHENRKCNLCTLNDIGDEMHYLLKCPYFSTKRNKFVSQKYYLRPNIIKYKELMSTVDPDKLNKLALFMKHIMKTFSR